MKIISDKLIVSASIDQRVILWQYNGDDILFTKNKIMLNPRSYYVTCIADVATLRLFKMWVSNELFENKWMIFYSDNSAFLIIVCGEGCEIIKCSV